MCEPFRVGAGEPADHTVRLTFSDRVPDPPQNALRQGPLYRWYTGSTRCTLQRYSAPGRTPQFTQAETRPGHTDLVFAESYRTGASARVVLESAGLFDILADAGMLVLHSAYIVTRQGEGILFSGPSGIGKSTQAALWQRYGAAQTVNGDRALSGPTPGPSAASCMPVPPASAGTSRAAAGPVVLLHQAPESPGDGYPAPGGLCRVLSQCAYHQWDPASAARMTELAARLVTNVPVRQLDCRADESAVRALEEALRRT